MPDSFSVGLVVTGGFGGGPGVPPPIVWEEDTFILGWEPTDRTKIAIIDSGVDIITEIDLPAVLNAVDDRKWNFILPADIWRRPTHYFMMGSNGGLVEPHSMIVNSRYDDTGFPFLLVWDWINHTTYGPLYLDNAVKQLEGPILIGSELFFFAVDAVTFKVQLFHTNADLTDPLAPVEGEVGAQQVGVDGPVVPSDRSLEFMFAQNTLVSILESPAGGIGSSGPFLVGHVWDTAPVSGPFLPGTVTVGTASYQGQLFNQPGQKFSTTDSFFLRSNIPSRVVTVDASNVIAVSLFNTGDWGTFLFSQRAGFTLLADGVTIRYFRDVGSGNNNTGTRTWLTGTVIEADAFFVNNVDMPPGMEPKLFPFEALPP